MANRSLGTLTLDLIAKIGGFTGPLDKAAREAERKAKQIQAQWGKMAKGVGIAAAAAGAAIVAGFSVAAVKIRESINVMDEMSKAAARVGLPTEDFSRLAYAGSLADVSVEKLQKTLGKLVKAQNDALNGSATMAEAFQRAGVAVENADGSMRKNIDVLYDFADYFKSQAGAPEAMALGMEIFGKSFQDIIPLIVGGSDAMREAAAEADALGITLSEEAGKNAEAFNDNLTRMETALNAVWQQISSQLLPDLVVLTDNLVELTKEGNLATEAADGMRNGFEFLRIAFEAVAVPLNAFIEYVKFATDQMMTFFETAQGVYNRLKGLDFSFSISGNVDQVKGFFGGMVSEAETAWNKITASAQRSQQDTIARTQEGWSVVNGLASGSLQQQERAQAQQRAAAREREQAANEESARRIREANEVGAARANLMLSYMEEQKELERKNALGEEATRLSTLEYDIQQGIIQGTQEELDVLRAQAKVLDDLDKKEEKKARGGRGGGDSEAKRAAREAEREAERQAQAEERKREQYQGMIEDLERRIALIGKEGEVASLSYDLQYGKLQDLSQEEKDRLLTLTQTLETREREQEVMDRAAEEAQRRQDDMDLYLEDLQFELDTLGKSADEIERMNALRQFGLTIQDESGKKLDATLQALQKQRKAIAQTVEVMDEVRSSFSGALSDWVSGSKSFKDAFTDALDSINQRIIQIISDNLIESLFGDFGTTGEGSQGGGFLSNLFGGLFGAKKKDEVAAEIPATIDVSSTAPYAEGVVMAMQSESQRMADGVISVVQQTMGQVAQSVGYASQQAAGGVQMTADTAITATQDVAANASSQISSAVAGAGSQVDGVLAAGQGGFFSKIGSWFSNLFNGEKGIFSIFKNLFSSIGGLFGGGGGGGGGFLSSLFGGFMANGGATDPFSIYRVNEIGPELLTVGNKDYLMMGSQAGRITPNHGLASGGGIQQVNNFTIQGKIDRRTESQIAMAVGQRSQVATSRNR